MSTSRDKDSSSLFSWDKDMNRCIPLCPFVGNNWLQLSGLGGGTGRGPGGNEGVSSPVGAVLPCHPGTGLQSPWETARWGEQEEYLGLQMAIGKATRAWASVLRTAPSRTRWNISL